AQGVRAGGGASGAVARRPAGAGRADADHPVPLHPGLVRYRRLGRAAARRYRAELRDHKDALKLLRSKAREGTVTLEYAARVPEHNGALVLKKILESRK